MSTPQDGHIDAAPVMGARINFDDGLPHIEAISRYISCKVAPGWYLGRFVGFGGQFTDKHRTAGCMACGVFVGNNSWTRGKGCPRCQFSGRLVQTKVVLRYIVSGAQYEPIALDDAAWNETPSDALKALTPPAGEELITEAATLSFNPGRAGQGGAIVGSTLHARVRVFSGGLTGPGTQRDWCAELQARGCPGIPVWIAVAATSAHAPKIVGVLPADADAIARRTFWLEERDRRAAFRAKMVAHRTLSRKLASTRATPTVEETDEREDVTEVEAAPVERPVEAPRIRRTRGSW